MSTLTAATARQYQEWAKGFHADPQLFSVQFKSAGLDSVPRTAVAAAYCWGIPNSVRSARALPPFEVVVDRRGAAPDASATGILRPDIPSILPAAIARPRR